MSGPTPRDAVPGRSRRGSLLPFAAGLALLTIAVYIPVVGFEFVNYDDPGYVTANEHVREGLTAGNFVWALGAFQNGNWHPLTLLSHMADVSAYGLDPRGHHATSLALHVLNVALLFFLLERTTGRPVPSAVVAALFAVHPLQVQSVAWIAERKNLLCTLFWLAALLAWVAWRRTEKPAHYALALAGAMLALAAKPMATTLPFTLLLFDRWPVGLPREGGVRTALRRAIAVVPFLIMSLACGIATLAAQRQIRALQDLESYPLAVRWLAVPTGYCWYLLKAILPTGLAVFYPHPQSTASVGTALLAVAVLAAICILVLRFGGSRRSLATGWWWYVVTLLPVSGVIQVGSQAFADRYAYVPLIGIFLLVVWALADRTAAAGRSGRLAAAFLAAAVVGGLSVACRFTLAPWHDSETLFRRAVAVVPDGAVAHNNLGMALVERGRVAEALEHFHEAVRNAPWDTDARSNLGSALTVLGRPVEALPIFDEALRLAPNDPSLRFNLARALAAAGRAGDAIAQLEAAMRADPNYPKAPLLLGNLLMDTRRVDEAVPVLRTAAKLAPRDPQARFSLAVALAATGRKAEALQRVEEVLRLDSSHPRARELAAMLRRDLGTR